MLRFFYIILNIQCLLALSLYASAQDAPLYKLEIKDTLIIEGCQNYAPFDFKDENGKLTGFNVEIMDALMKRMNVAYKYRQVTSEELYKHGMEGKIDIASGITYSNQSRQFFLYGIPICYVWFKIVSLDSHPYNDMNSLKGKRIAMRTKTWMDGSNSSELKGVKEIVVEENWDKFLDLLLTGKVDAIIAGGFPIEFIAEKKGIKKLHYASFSDKPMMHSFAVTAGNEELLFRLNEEIQMLKRDGTYYKIYNKWFAVKEQHSTGDTILMIVAVIAILFALFCLIQVYRYARKNRIYVIRTKVALHASKMGAFVYNPRTDKVTIMDSIGTHSERKFLLSNFMNSIVEEDRDILINANKSVYEGKEESMEIQVHLKEDLLEYGGIIMELHLKKSQRRFERPLIVGTVRDVTEQVMAEVKLNEEKKQAEIANNMKSMFLANMSHDIRTPLNAIVGASELLTEEDDAIDLTDEDKKEMLDMIKMNVNVATTLVSDLLNVTQMESGVYKVNIAGIKLNAFCKVALDSIKSRAQQGVEVRCVFSEDDDYKLNTDPVRLQQILTNYLTNACKYTKSGHIELRYEVLPDLIRFTVSDTGIGISKENAESCFEMFNMLGSKVAGHGLGLYICKLTSNILCGRAYVDTAYTHGARFVFDHPLNLTQENILC